MMRRASWPRARATSTSCRWPGGSSPTRRSGPNVEADAGQQGAGVGAHAAVVEPAEGAADHFLAAEEEVGGDAQVLGEVQLLVDEDDAAVQGVADALQVDRLSVEEDFAAVGPVDAGQDFHERRFAGPVLADEGQHLVGVDGQRHAVEGLNAREVLADVADFEEGRCCHRHTRNDRRAGGVSPLMTASCRRLQEESGG